MISRIAEIWKGDDVGYSVAAFNTGGWFKRAIRFPLKPWLNPASPLDGLYIRTDFCDFHFFPHAESTMNDIRRIEPNNDVPGFVRACKSEPSCAGFNTNGWLKTVIKFPLVREPTFISPWHGTFLRIHWPDFIFLPGIDSPGNDMRSLGKQPLPVLINAARTNPEVLAFNTNGRMKFALTQEPTPWPHSEWAPGTQPEGYQHRGLYVRATHGNPHTLLHIARFALLSTGGVFAQRFIGNEEVRDRYKCAVKMAGDEILERVLSGAVRARDGAQEAFDIRNALEKMCVRTHRLGLAFTETVRPTIRTYEYHLDRYARQAYSKNFAQLTQRQAQEVSTLSIKH